MGERKTGGIATNDMARDDNMTMGGKVDDAAARDRSTDDWFAIRPGEVTVDMPAAFDAGVYFIGRIRTPWTARGSCPRNSRESDALCTIEVDPRYAEALEGVEAGGHLLVLYWMDKARRDLVVQMPRHHSSRRGTFSLRSPARPNPIAASIVRLERIDGCSLSVIGLDCLDGTPLIDLKPAFPALDFASG